jgi:hypothetical protein
VSRYLLILVLAGFGAAALADLDRAERSVWGVAGKEVLSISVAAGGLSPAERIERLDERLNEILSQSDDPLRPEEIVLGPGNGFVRILARKTLLVTVSEADARSHHATCDGLAKTWLSNLRKTLPQLSPRVNVKGI